MKVTLALAAFLFLVELTTAKPHHDGLQCYKCYIGKKLMREEFEQKGIEPQCEDTDLHFCKKGKVCRSTIVVNKAGKMLTLKKDCTDESYTNCESDEKKYRYCCDTPGCNKGQFPPFPAELSTHIDFTSEEYIEITSDEGMDSTTEDDYQVSSDEGMEFTSEEDNQVTSDEVMDFTPEDDHDVPPDEGIGSTSKHDEVTSVEDMDFTSMDHDHAVTAEVTTEDEPKTMQMEIEELKAEQARQKALLNKLKAEMAKLTEEIAEMSRMLADILNLFTAS